MKKRTKAFLLVLCAIMLVTASIMGTVAYLTSTTETVSNTFSVGQVHITLSETKVDVYGAELTGEDAGTTSQGQAYKMLPSHEYVKDPTITVTAGSEPCWLFVKVDNGISAYEAKATANTIASQLTANGWTLVDGQTNVYWHAVVDAREEAKTVQVFEKFVIADNANTVDGWSAVTSENTKVSVTAYAIQSDGFTDAESAWAALNPAP